MFLGPFREELPVFDTLSGCGHIAGAEVLGYGRSIFEEGSYRAMSLFKPWTWMKLDPARTIAARDHFDKIGRYDEWHELCRAHFARHCGSSGGELAQKGVEIVRSLSVKPPRAKIN
jgi:hypothetical protein